MILLRLLIKMPPNRRPTLSCSGFRRWTRHLTTAADGATRLRGTEHSVFSWRMAVQALCWMAWHPPSHVYMCNRHDAELILHVPLTILLVLREASHGSAQRCLAVNGWAPPDPISGRRRVERKVSCGVPTLSGMCSHANQESVQARPRVMFTEGITLV